MNAQYCIEKVEFVHGILSVIGWIFSGETNENEIRQLKLVFVSNYGKAVECHLSFLPRPDVAHAYGLLYDKVGFSFRGSLKFSQHVNAYLVYSFLGGKSRIPLTELKGTNSDCGIDNIRIEYPEFDGYYNVRNFRFLKKRFQFLQERKDVDVIIPVYNGYTYLDRLFSSVLKTGLQMHMIIINDCSTDARINHFFGKFCKEHANVLYIENETNLGFVKSVNKALRFSKHDVALVNTDVEVPSGWLERLMQPIFQDSNVASATPYTNCGTLCSFPEIGKDNRIFDDRSVLYVDAVFRGVVPAYAQMPTGVGFCMGMSRRAVEKVGFLDEEHFSKGYGEENDWCQRAVKLGFKNVQVENLFVYHKHGGSFLSEEKENLLKENMKNLNQKHPFYQRDVARYFEDDVNKAYRKYAFFMCLMQRNTHTVVYFNHALGGGADDYMVKQKKKLLKDEQVKFIEFQYHAYQNIYQMEITYKDYCMKLYSDSFDDIYSNLRLTQIQEIFVNELVSYPDVFFVLQKILFLKKEFGLQLTMLLHDFFCICPTINLLLDQGVYCEMNCEYQDCLQHNRYLYDAAYDDISEWRRHWGEFLKNCDSILAFSEDSEKKIKNIYGNLPGLRVVLHTTDKMLTVSKKYKFTETVNIAVLGVLGRHKGLYVIKEMIAMIEKRNLPVNMIVIGTCDEKFESSHCIVTGRYTREQLPGLMYLYDIDIIFIASIWPETFSYTAQEAMKMKMPVAVFDLGAPAERVKKYEKGIVIKQITADAALNKITEVIKKQMTAMKRGQKKVLFLIEYESFSSRYRVDHLREHLAIKGIESAVVMLQDLDLQILRYYDVISVYRCSNLKKISLVAQRAKQLGIRLIYDIDDYIFEYKKIQHLEFLKYEEYDDFQKYTGNIKECINLCDTITTSTNHLAQAITESFANKKVIICRNAACLEMQLLSEIAVDKDEKFLNRDWKKTDKITLGYFSGSKTHNQDWGQIEECIFEIMEENVKVALLIVGPLKISDKFKRFSGRVLTMPFVRWQELPGIIRSVNINLMPLEDNFFQWCKSENKWMEAGLVEIPTIAGYNPELASVLEDGKNVVFCKDIMEWKNQLTQLILDQNLRKKIGWNAKEEVYKTHLVTNDENFNEIVQEILF